MTNANLVQADDLKSRYLLTFASAAIANEWWELIQANFPADSSRPGPQLFSFKQDDLLAKAWKHPAFDHLRTKWMFIQFGDVGNVGGAAQGIIPVQDVDGNMLGGSAGAAAAAATHGELGQVKKEARSVRNELSVLEEHFEKMMGAVERNTEAVASLADRRTNGEGGESRENDGTNGVESSADSQFDLSELSEHLGRISGQLTRNLENAESLARKQDDNGKRVVAALEKSTKQRSEKVDLSQVSPHLEKIRKLLEDDIKSRKASEKSASQVDMSVVASHLEGIHSAIGQQSAHMQTLLGSAHGEGDAGRVGGDEADVAVRSLGEHLEQIYRAIEEGNSQARKQKFDVAPLSKRLDDLLKVQRESSKQKPDLSPLTEHLDAIRAATDHNSERLAELVEAHQSNVGKASSIDLTPLNERLGRIHASLERQAEAKAEQSPGSGDGKFILSALASHLSKIQNITEQNAQHVRALREKQSASQDKMHIAVAQSADQIRTIARRNEELESREEAREAQMRELLSGQREMVEVMRELARSIRDKNGWTCDHVVIPPPRKVGRKIVGFVYDAKEGSV